MATKRGLFGETMVNGLPQFGSGLNFHTNDYKGPQQSDFDADQKKIDDAIAKYQDSINTAIGESYKKGFDYITGYNQGADRAAQQNTQVTMESQGLGRSPIAAALQRQYAAGTARDKSSQIAQLNANKADLLAQSKQAAMGMGVGALASNLQNFRTQQNTYGMAVNAQGQKTVSDIISGIGSLAKSFIDSGSKAAGTVASGGATAAK